MGPVRLTTVQRALGEQLLEEHGDQLWNMALVVAGSRQAAEDLLATALAAALPYLDRIQVPATAYIWQVMLNQRSTAWRRRRGFTEESHAQVPERADPTDHPATVILREEIAAALGVLGDRQRAVLVLRFLQDLSIAEVAQILNCTEATVRSQSHRGLAKLRSAPWLFDKAGDQTFRSTV